MRANMDSSQVTTVGIAFQMGSTVRAAHMRFAALPDISGGIYICLSKVGISL